MIELSKLTVNEIIDGTEKAAPHDLNRKEDLERLIVLVSQSGKYGELEDFSFKSKYLMGLIKVLRSQSVNNEEEYLKKLNGELTLTYSQIQDLMRSILEVGSSFIQSIFEEKYLKLSYESLDNLNKLCEDFSYLKLFINDLKQKKDSE